MRLARSYRSTFIKNAPRFSRRRIVLYLILLCALGAIGAIVWDIIKMKEAYYLKWSDSLGLDWWIVEIPDPDYDPTTEFFLSGIVQYFYFFLLMANFVPVSLYVSMSTVKFFQAHFIEADLEIYHEVRSEK